MTDLKPIEMEELMRIQDAENPSARKFRLGRAGWIVLAIVVAAAAWFLLRGGDDTAAAPPPPAVTVAAPIVRQVADWDDYVGRFEATRGVELRPRVSGQVTAVHFQEGQAVRQGQPLFTIDPRPYQAALAEAQAGIATARSDLVLARSDLERALRLVEDDAVSKSEIDSLRARVSAGEASLAAAQARVRSRALDVEFATVRSPISGRISDRLVDPGNTVIADQTPLTHIVSVDPIHFSFESSEALLLKYQRQDSGKAGTPVRVKLQDEATYGHAGRIDFVDPAIDPGSGTVHARAVLPNPDGFLKPGMVGRLQLAGSGAYPAILVPDLSVVTDASRRLIYTVGPDGTVKANPVELGPLVGDLRVIRSGISAKDRVIIGGVQRARPGQKVQTQNGTIKVAATQTAAPSERAPQASAAEIVAPAK